MRTILKLGLFLLSNAGYWEYFRRKHQINRYFAPVFTIAVQFTALFAAGILNGLEDMTFVLYATGLLLFFRFLYETKLRGLLQYVDAGYLFFAAAFLLAGSAVYGMRFSHIDNFTHWATVVRSMLFMDRFPCYQDVAVTFTTYPLGTAAYIYYFCRLTNDAEFFQMLAQAYIMICAVLPVFAFTRKNKLLCMLFVAAMTGFFFQYNVPLTDLQVDTVMPLAGIAAAAFVYCHCVSGEEGKKLSGYYAFPMLLWLMNIKHPAILYVVIAMAVLLAGMEKSGKRKKEFLILVAALLLAKRIWSLHCDYVFYPENAGMHSMSADWFRFVMGGKTPEDVRKIVSGFVRHVLTQRNYFWFLTWLVLLGALAAWRPKTERGRYITLLTSAVVLYVLYAVGVLGMYVFSMPVWEGLSGVERYMKSLDVAVYYLFSICAVSLLSQMDTRKLALPVAAAITVLTLLGWNFQSSLSSEGGLYCTEAERQSIEAPIAEYGPDLGRSYLLCISADMKSDLSDLPRYIWGYNLLSDSVDQIVVTEESQLEIEKDYDYVVIFDRDNPVIQKWLQQTYPGCVGEMLIQHFV